MVKIGVITERNYEIFGKLFGVRTEKSVKPLAAKRGIPANTSNRDELDENKESIVFHSWVDWEELKGFLPNINICPELSGWSFIFSSMERLAEEYGNKNVRLIVAFDNYG
ncbi:hypothetical protein [Gynuella sp.]|uniref:hypothetical protein n=1 Tax=Gynuella sp. TaxID=2969146 RepID=UPI003D1030C1